MIRHIPKTLEPSYTNSPSTLGDTIRIPSLVNQRKMPTRYCDPLHSLLYSKYTQQVSSSFLRWPLSAHTLHKTYIVQTCIFRKILN